MLVGLSILSVTQSALAHPGHPGHGFADGALHPLFGFDHLLAMVAVGLLASGWVVERSGFCPARFLTGMLVGGGLGTLGTALPFVELAILASVLVLGLLVAARGALPLATAALVVASFAVFHGHVNCRRDGRR